MSDATITSKGQVTIPVDIRRALDLGPSDKVTFTLMPDGTVQMRAKSRSLDDAAGVLRRRTGTAVPIELLGLGSGGTRRRVRPD